MSSIVHSLAYREGAPVADFHLADAKAHLQRPNSFVWLGLHEPDDQLLGQVQAQFDLHALAIEDAHHAHQRPKLEAYGSTLFIVLKTAELEAGQAVYGETHLFVGKCFLVSVRHGASSSYGELLHRGTEARLPSGTGFVLHALLDFVTDRYQPIVAQLEQDFDAIEADIFQDRIDRLVIERLYTLKRQLLALRNAALPVAEICAELVRLHEDLMAKELRPYFRDVEDHVARLAGQIDAMRDMLNTAMQVNLAVVANNQNEVVKKLAGWGAILAIPTVVFSLYGMNFRWMPELHWQAGYPVTVGITLLACAWVYRRLRRAAWV